MTSRPCPYARRRTRVAVLVDLVRTDNAGGHVKCWERFAQVAASMDADAVALDLTVYFLGAREGTEVLAPHVRFVTLRPVFGSGPFTRLVGGVDATDFSPYHPALARLLDRHDVWHATHMFALSATAARLAGRRGHRGRHGLVASVHTDVPALTQAYAGLGARRLQAAGSVRGGARRTQWIAGAATALMRHRRDRLLKACDRVMVSTTTELAEFRALLGDRVSLLGRGTDHSLFLPDPGARAELRRHGVPDGHTAVLFVGRVDASKQVMLLAEGVRRARESGHPVHLVVAGTGADTRRIEQLLGGGVTLLGSVPQRALARVYAGCDVFAFPSHTETAGNVVAEAMACGLPVVLPAGVRTTAWLPADGTCGLLVGKPEPAAWARALTWLARYPETCRAMGRRAAAVARAEHRGWDRVLADDLLPVWHAAAPHVSSGGL
ncbi:glycosyltransferase [Yinghuangia sp. YIM S10712]|uniref:glycosyltransferase n=1 Tax=Yinghuangia sp. YIM S10712 TaxID=3436930 RepID=UPI003F5350CE